MDNIQTHFLLTSEFLNPIAVLLQENVTKVIEIIAEKIPVKDVDIIFFDQRDDYNSYAQVDPKTGLGQFAVSPHVIYVAVAADNSEIYNGITGKPLRNVLAHSLYHCLRGQSLTMYEQNLISGLVEEGLAAHFEIEMTGEINPELYFAITGEKLNEFWKKAKKAYWDKNYSYSKWFLGRDSEIPHGYGHSLGYKVVSDYLAKYPGKNASTLYTRLPKEFVISD